MELIKGLAAGRVPRPEDKIECGNQMHKLLKVICVGMVRAHKEFQFSSRSKQRPTHSVTDVYSDALSVRCPCNFIHFDTVYSIHRVGRNRNYTPYMTVYLVISLPKIPYKHRTFWPTL